MSRGGAIVVTDYCWGTVASFIAAEGAMTTEEQKKIHQMKDNDLHKGAFEEEDNPRQKPQARFKGQLSHRESDPLIKASDSDFPEPGPSPEHSGEPEE